MSGPPRLGELNVAVSMPTPQGPNIDVWTVSLRDDQEGTVDDIELLSTAEAARAARFRFPKHYHRFVRRRIALRLLLSAYCDIIPNSFDYEVTKLGKPALPSAFGQICFNGSHSRDLAVIAICNHPVGIDLEAISFEKDIPSLIPFICTQTETNWLERMAVDAQVEAFFRLWAMKEAIVKLSGAGLTADLDQIETNLHDSTQHPSCSGEVLDAVELPIASGFCGAVAVNATDSPPRLTFHQFDRGQFR